MLCEHGLETRSVEHLASAVMRLHQAITVEEEALSRRYGDFMLLVPAAGQHPKRHPCGPEGRCALAVTVIGQVMPCIGVAQLPTCGIKQGKEAGDKHPLWNRSLEQIVDPLEDLARRAHPLWSRAQHRLDRGHH